MADIVYGIRITGEADSAKRAFDETKRSQEQLTGAEKANTRAAQDVERANKRKEDSLNRLRLGILAAGAATLVFMRSSVNAAVEAERAQNRLEAVLRATGGAAGVTREEYSQLAESLAAATQFDDDSIRNAQAELVKFGNIHGQVFKEALRLSADLAAFMGTDVAQGAQMIGRALQSPTEGLRLIEREFGRLNDAEEKHINTLVAQGRAVEAQNAVLELLQGKIGGTADLMNTGLTKATGDLSKAWDDMLKAVGRTTAMMGAAGSGGVLGFFTKLLKATEDVAKNFDVIGRAFKGDFGARSAITDPGLAAAQQREQAGLRPAPRVVLGGDTQAARERERAAEEAARDRAQVAADEAAALQAQQDILDEASRLGVQFSQAQDAKRIALEKEAEAVRDAINPWNAYAREVERLRGLMEKGLITHGEFTAAVALEARQVAGAYDEMADRGVDAFDELRDAIEGWGQDLSRELARGEVSLRSIGRIFEELLAMQIQRRIMQPLLESGTSFLDNLFASSTSDAYLGNAAPFHGGGIVGREGGASRFVHPAYFEGAPRLHGGLMPGEYPAILQRGEGVFTPEQMRAMGGAPSVKIEINNQVGSATAQLQGQPWFDGTQWVVSIVLKAAATDAGFRQQLGGYLKPPEH